MTIQNIIELFYLTIFTTIIGFMVFFYIVTRKPPRGGVSARERADGGAGRGMDRRERQWLYFLIAVALLGNLATLSPLVPAAKNALWAQEQPVKQVVIEVRDYKFILPEKPITIPAGVPVEFIVISDDLTYGFGVFRKDGTMVFQMQVVPKPYENRITWVFEEPGHYDIRSTEYSGPKHPYMYIPDAIAVVGGGGR